jgi:DNA-directed RNA polymerase specialized sigma24 family protein
MAPLHPISRPAAVRGDLWATIEETGALVLPGMLRLLRVPENDVEDLVQQVLLAAFTSRHRYSPRRSKASGRAAPSELPGSAAGRPPGRAGAPPSRSRLWADLSPEQQAAARWLFGIAWRQVSHHVDRACYRRHVPQGLRNAACFQGVAATPGGDAVIEERQRRELAIALLGAVAPRGRVLLLLHDACEMPLCEIAEMLGININTAGTRLRRARDEYRAAAKRLRPEERRALRGCPLLLLPSIAQDLVREGADTTDARGAPRTHAPAPAQRSSWPGRLAPRGLHPLLRPIVAGVAGAAALVLAASPISPRARCFGEAVARLVRAHDVSAAGEEPGPEARRGAAAAGRRHAPGPEQPARAAEDRETLEEARRLLAAVSRLIEQGDRAAALERIAAHARRFPNGRLSQTREALRASVLGAGRGSTKRGGQ